MQRELMPGDEVMLIPDPRSVGYVNGLAKWDGCRFKISRVRYGQRVTTKSARQGAIYYELKGCVSAKGVPYGILREWIMPTGGRE